MSTFFEWLLESSEQHAFLKSIDDAPKEWTGWLAYADYLDETDDPLNHKKADLIRKRYEIWQADQNAKSHRKSHDDYYTSVKYNQQYHDLKKELEEDKEHEYRLAHTELGGTLPDRSEPLWKSRYRHHRRPETDISHVASLLTYNHDDNDSGIFVFSGVGPHLDSPNLQYKWLVKFGDNEPIKTPNWLRMYGDSWQNSWHVKDGIYYYELYVDNGNKRRYKEKYKGWTPSIPIADDPKKGYGGMIVYDIWQKGEHE